MEQERARLDFNNIFYGWWIVIAGFCISFYVGSIIFYGFTAFFEPLVREFGWSYAQVSFAASFRGIEMSILAPVAGFLVDRFGSRLMILCGVIIVGMGLIFLSWTQSLWMFYLGYILVGFGGGGCSSVVLVKCIASWFHRDIGKATGIMTSGFGASGLMLPMIVWLIDAYGWRAAMVVMGVGMFIIGIPLSMLVRNTPESCGLHPDGREPEHVRNPVQAFSSQGEKWRVLLRSTLKHPVFIGLAVSEMIRMTAAAAVFTHIMPYLSSLDYSRATAGLIAGSISVLSIAGRFGLGWLADLFNKRLILAATYGLTSLGLLALCYVDTRWFLFLFLGLFSIGYGGSMVLRAALLRESFGRDSFGRLFGLILGAAAIGGLIGPALAGMVFDASKNYLFAWLGLSISTAFAAILMWLVPSKNLSSSHP
ncbi:MAG: MFS transporter [Acidobacteria bacterium]|nr:MFS transporter [Acidobacteriota bacterium]